jgi:hypothetical protein
MTAGPEMRIGVSARGVEIDDGQGGVLAPWSDVHRVTAYALDVVVGTVRHVSFDLVNGHSVEMNDTMPEWDDMVVALPGLVELTVDDLPAVLDGLLPDGEPVAVAGPVRVR